MNVNNVKVVDTPVAHIVWCTFYTKHRAVHDVYTVAALYNTLDLQTYDSNHSL